MRVLLDENTAASAYRTRICHRAYAGWAGVTNGDLLNRAERAFFDVFVTCDKGLSYQQNLTARKIGVVMLTAHSWPIIRNNLPAIQAAVDRAGVGTFEVVECGRFQR